MLPVLYASRADAYKSVDGAPGGAKWETVNRHVRSHLAGPQAMVE
jgi:hypothetical protein